VAEILYALEENWRTVQEVTDKLNAVGMPSDRVTIATWCAAFEREGLLRVRMAPTHTASGPKPAQYTLSARFGGSAL
jgi:hypothetical protein